MGKNNKNNNHQSTNKNNTTSVNSRGTVVRKIKIIAFFFLIGAGIKKFLLPITAVVSIAIGAGGALMLSSNNDVAETPFDTRSVVGFHPGSELTFSHRETNVNNVTLAPNEIAILEFNKMLHFDWLFFNTFLVEHPSEIYIPFWGIPSINHGRHNFSNQLNNFVENLPNDFPELHDLQFVNTLNRNVSNNLNEANDIWNGIVLNNTINLGNNQPLTTFYSSRPNVSSDWRFDFPDVIPNFLNSQPQMSEDEPYWSWNTRMHWESGMYNVDIRGEFRKNLSFQSAIILVNGTEETTLDNIRHRVSDSSGNVNLIRFSEEVTPIRSADIHYAINIDNLNYINILDFISENIRIVLVNEQNASAHRLYEEGNLIITPLDTLYNTIPNELGTFRFIVEVKDDFGNISDFKLFFHTLDVKPPQVTGSLIQHTDNRNLLSIEEILSNISIYDNVDGLIDINYVIVLEDNYTANYNRAGVHTILFRVSDSSGNHTDFTISIEVSNVIPPVISGLTELSRDIDTPLTVGGVWSKLTANSCTDGDLGHRIEVISDNFTGNERTAGNHTILFRVVDNAGNPTYHTVTITNLSNVMPGFVVDGNVIIVERGTEVSRDQLVDLLRQSGAIQTETNYTVEVDSNFFGNENIENVFDARITIRDAEGNIVEVRYIDISVQEELFQDVDVPMPYETEGNSSMPWTWIVIGIIAMLAVVGFVLSKSDDNKVAKNKA